MHQVEVKGYWLNNVTYSSCTHKRLLMSATQTGLQAVSWNNNINNFDKYML